MTSNSPKTDRRTWLIMVDAAAGRIFGLDTRERTKRIFARAGVQPAPADAKEAGHVADTMLLVRSDAVLDPALTDAVLARPGLILLDTDATTPLLAHVPAAQTEVARRLLLQGDAQTARKAAREHGWQVLSPAGLADAAFQKKLRKREAPYALLYAPARKDALEWRVFMGTYKGATDVVTKRLWPRPAFHVTRWLAEHTSVTPNMVTFLSFLLVLVAFGLFATGAYGWGLLAAWLMTFLDTVDGKLARTTLTSSKFGDIFDHGIDLVHPPFWYAAWALGLQASGHPLPPAWWWGSLIVIIAGYVIQRLVEGIAIAFLGMEIHIWRRFDTWFREITARRNPNLVLLTLSWLVGRPDWGLLAVAAWTLVSLLVHAVQLLQAFAEKRRKGELTSWMAREAHE